MDRKSREPFSAVHPKDGAGVSTRTGGSLQALVRSLFPDPYLQHILKGAPLPSGKGAFLFVDVSGFTRISEAILRYGTLGTEMLTQALNRMFSAWISRVERHGGVVYRLAGDAIHALFPGVSGAEQAAHAVREIMTWSRKEAAFTLPEGETVRLALHAGLAWGRFAWKELGNQDWVTGSGWVRAMRAAARAHAFTLVAERAAYERLSPVWSTPLPYRTYRQIHWETLSTSPPEVPGLQTVQNLSEKETALLLSMLPRNIREWLMETPGVQALHGEHRWISMVFLYLRSSDSRQGIPWLRHRLAEVRALARRTGGLVSRVEPAASGARLVVLFGYPRMLDFPSREATRFMHYLRETLPPGSYRGSIHGGTVFAGLVGSDRRRELTMMGDPANTAARIAARAPWGTLWASREIQHQVRASHIPVRSRTLRLKGKKKPHRVAELHPRRERWKPGASVGREEEYRIFLNHIRRNPRWVVGISGAAGMGKSHFLQQLAGNLEQMGFTVLVGYGVRDPLWILTPFRVMLRRFLGTGPEVVSRLERYGLKREQAGLVADVLGVNVPAGPHPVLPAEMIPEARQQALRTLLYGIARQHGSLVLLLDDVHWMDAESRTLLEAFWRHAPEGLTLGMGCAFRPEGETARWLKNWPGYREIPLSPLDARAVQQMARTLLGGVLDSRSATWILSRSGGNPLVLHEWLRVLRDRHELVQTGRYWKLRRHPETPVSPDHVHNLVHQRMDALPPALRRVVQHASVLGMVFSPAFLAHLLHVQIDQLPLAELQKRGFIEVLPEGSYRFVHTLIRDAVYHALPHGQRRQLHARAAQYLLQRGERAPALLLYHAHHAGEHRRTRTLGERLARLALRRQDTTAAIRFSTWALAHTRPGKKGWTDRARLLLLRAEAHTRAGDWEQALQDLRRVDTGDVDVAYRARARIAAAEILAMGFHRYEEARTTLQSVAPLLDQGVDLWIRGLWLEKRAVVAYHMGQYAEAVQHGEAALRIYEQTHRWIQAGDLKNDLGVYYSDLGQGDRAEQLLVESAAFSASRGDVLGQAITLSNLAAYRSRAGRFEDALIALRQAEDLCHASGEPPVLKFVYWRMGEVHTSLGDIKAATRAYALALRYARQGHDRLMESLVLQALGRTRLQVGMIPMAVQLLQKAVQIQEDLQAPQLPLSLAFLADALVLYGEASRARKVLHRVLRFLESLPPNAWLTLNASLLALRLLVELEDWSRVDPLLERLHAQGVDETYRVLLEVIEAYVLMRKGRRQKARERIQSLIPSLVHQEGMGERNITACLLAGEVLVQTGNPLHGGILLRQITSWVFRKGYRGWLIRCGDALARYYRKQGDGKRMQLWQRSVQRMRHRF